MLLQSPRFTERPPPHHAIDSSPGRARAGTGAGGPRLVVTQGPSAGKSLVLTRARSTIGRDATHDLVLDDPRVSATHLELELREEGRLLARDVGTTNGTWLGPHRVFEVELGPGALLSLGDSVVRVEIDLEDAPEEDGEAGCCDGLVGASPEMGELLPCMPCLPCVAPPELPDLAGTFSEAKARAVERFELAYLDALLRRCAGNLSKASRQAEIARNHLRALLKKRGLYAPVDP